MAEKDVIFPVEESLWQRAKIRAAVENIPLKELVARAIENELLRLNELAKVSIKAG